MIGYNIVFDSWYIDPFIYIVKILDKLSLFDIFHY